MSSSRVTRAQLLENSGSLEPILIPSFPPPTHPPTRHLLPVVAASLLREIGYKYIFLQRSLGGGVGRREMIPPPDSREEGFWVEKLGVCSNRRSVGHADSRRPLRISTLFFLSNLSPFLPSIFLSRLVSSLLFRTCASRFVIR